MKGGEFRVKSSVTWKELPGGKAGGLPCASFICTSFLCNEKKEFVLSKQVLRSGTGIGANLAEAECAISRKDFLSKIYIALKECSETLYWLDLLRDTSFLTEEMHTGIYRDGEELKRLLTSTTKTVSRQIKDNSPSAG